jgi:hypothetical protein
MIIYYEYCNYLEDINTQGPLFYFSFPFELSSQRRNVSLKWGEEPLFLAIPKRQHFIPSGTWHLDEAEQHITICIDSSFLPDFYAVQ